MVGRVGLEPTTKGL